MSTDLLFEHFATLATAPDGIARLRELILQLAVQGKLGTQNAGDEPASVLLTTLKKEKALSIEKGIIRNSKELAPILSDEILYPIPEKWDWGIINDIGKNEQNAIVDGPFGSNLLKSEYIKEGGYPVITISNLERGFDKKNIRFISKEKFETLKRSAVKPGDIIMGKIGSCGKAGYYPESLPEGIIPANLLKVTVSEKVDKSFVFIFFNSRFFKYELNLITKTTAQPAFGVTNFKQLFFPLPPLTEQHRIVAKVDRLMAICDELEARQQQERAGCLRLGTASLAGLQNAESPEEFGRQWAQVYEAFDLILDCPENVAVLQQTILQLAVQGRLVRQEPGAEPTANLVGMIRQEKERLVKEGKIKHEKPLKKIKEVQYKVPDGWQLCQLGEISEIIMGNSPPGNTYNPYGDGVPLINGPTEFSKPPLGKTIVSQYTTQPTKFCKENDLLICVRGATTGRTNIAGFDACIGRGVAVIRSPSIQSYLNFFILTKAQQILDMGTGSTFPSISQNDLLTIPVPLPPLAEQNRIVAKVDALMALCDALESRLKERAGVQSKFTDAVVMKVGSE
jgi:type I restriction enzyme S subunit